MNKYAQLLTMAMLLVSFSACCQSGPRGQRVKWDQVIHPDYLGEKVTLVKAATTVRGGAIVNSGTNIWTIYFDGSGSGSSGEQATYIEAEPGMIMAWAGHIASTSDIPRGWLLCDGSAYSTNTYATLFDAIGFRYSVGVGDTFNVPDYRGVALVGVEGDRGLYASTNRVPPGFGATKTEVGSFQVEAYATTNSSEIVRLANTYVNWLIKWRPLPEEEEEEVDQGTSHWPYPIRLPYYLTSDTGTILEIPDMNQIVSCMVEIRAETSIKSPITEVLGVLNLVSEGGGTPIPYTLARACGIYSPHYSGLYGQNVYIANFTLFVPANTTYRVYIPSFVGGTPSGYTVMMDLWSLYVPTFQDGSFHGIIGPQPVKKVVP